MLSSKMASDYPCLYNNSWFLVFFHDSSFGKFESKREGAYSLKKNKFSVLKNIDDSFKINGVFEFLLKYPNATGQNHWTQTVSPAYAQPNTENGYVPINISWRGDGFQGLSLSNSSTAYIDGSPFHPHNFFAIGSMYNCGYLPSFSWGNDNVRYYQVFLWMRVNDPSLIRKLFGFCTVVYKKQKINACYLSLLFIIS